MLCCDTQEILNMNTGVLSLVPLQDSCLWDVGYNGNVLMRRLIRSSACCSGRGICQMVIPCEHEDKIGVSWEQFA